jgi:hypothetical protein
VAYFFTHNQKGFSEKLKKSFINLKNTTPYIINLLKLTLNSVTKSCYLFPPKNSILKSGVLEFLPISVRNSFFAKQEKTAARNKKLLVDES